MADTRFFPLAAGQQNLKRLLLIRLIVFVCQFIAMVYAWAVLRLELSYAGLSATLLVVVLVNAALAMRVNRQAAVNDREFLLHLLFDVLSLTVLLYLSGGANNPFVSFYLVPITISAAILPWTYTWAVAGLSLLAYTLLLFRYQPLPMLMPEGMVMDHGGETPSLHILGMWFNFLVSAILITYFVVKMATAIRSQENVLNRYREENLRNEQILAVATQAAGTAHELGTPLNTMAILVREMADDYPGNDSLSRDIRMLETQINACRQSLKDLVSRADLRQARTGLAADVVSFAQQIREQWSLLRPETPLELSVSTPGESPAILLDTTLQQAVMNILNNAADASPERVEMEVAWDDASWSLRVRDFGDGIREEVVKYLGSEIISDKDKGMGVGMILTQASINRLGGRIMIAPHPQKGTVTEIRMPFDAREGREPS